METSNIVANISRDSTEIIGGKTMETIMEGNNSQEIIIIITIITIIEQDRAITTVHISEKIIRMDKLGYILQEGQQVMKM